MIIQQALSNATKELLPITDHPALEAEILLAFILDKPRSYLHARSDTALTAREAEEWTACLSRRLKKEPIAYITGCKEFWTLQLQVTSSTLIPRPETELLVETALNLHPFPEEATVADLGTGSGAIALALASERPAWQIDATDISAEALGIASKNAQQFGLNNVTFLQGNWFTAFSAKTKKFDLIVSNPPYLSENEWVEYGANLSYEPLAALVAGIDGLDAIREISSAARHHLKPGGYLMVEHGFSQSEAVRCIFAADGYNGVRTVQDLAGHGRVTFGHL